jgi:serine/threonine protein kinase
MIGRRLAHYDITAHLGSGGMGDVYQATDSKLGRSVALKFLPEAFARDHDRTARFKQEARTLAALNHPNIATIHGLEETDGRMFLVMELVPGHTLAQRIAGVPLAVEEALCIARQIADALEAAHDKSIVHRDLKPANVKVAADGHVKVLDFGLAKLIADEPGAAGTPTSTPTITAPQTRAGAVLGTPAYMAPEQARGRAVDRRADLFAFGCVLYEMLAGRPAFDGDSTSDILSSVLQRDPDWSRLPPALPAGILRLLRLCLEKDAKKRRQSAGDVRVDLEQPAEPLMAAAPPVRTGWSRLVRGATMVGAVAALAAMAIPAATHLREPRPSEMRLHLVTPPTRDLQSFAVSPDGRYLVFAATDSGQDAPDRLFLRALDQSDAHPLAGTERARLPFWSPDSRSVGFFAAGRLHRVDIAGGPPQALTSAAAPLGGAWSADGTILFAPNTVSPLFRVTASGGQAVPATTLENPRQASHRRPSFLPDGRRFLFQAVGVEQDASGLYLGSLDGGAPTRLAAADGGGAFLAPDRLVFVQQGNLVARRFDLARGVLTNDVITLATSVGPFSVSPSGTIAHRADRRDQTRMAWFDRTGHLVGQLAAVLNGPEISPDGRHLTGDRTVAGNRDVWLMDAVRGGLTRLTSHSAVDGYPLWSPDGGRIAFHSQRNGTIDLWIRPSNGVGAEELLLATPDAEWPMHWSADGRFLLYQRSDLGAGFDLWALPMIGADRTPIPVATAPFVERMGEFSPDGRWVAFETDESGRPEVVVQAFPEPHGRWPVSTEGGQAPRWSADGHEIYFVSLDGTLIAVPVLASGQTFEPGSATPLFQSHLPPQVFKYQYAVSRDGRFLINFVVAEASALPINLILNAAP